MTQDTRDTIQWVIGTIIGMLVILAYAVRFILIPYLRDTLVAPIKETHKQVTENHHSNAQPTVLDRIDDVQQDVQRTQGDVRSLMRVMDAHLDWSDRWVTMFERQLLELHTERGQENDQNPTT